MGERRGTKGLELWCKRMTEGYPGVKIENMTTSWRDGLAFCAIIHHFRPELIDFKKLKKEDVYANNELAFRVAEQYLGIPALLEAEDMVEYPVPDRLSILTYLSQFYQAFAVTQSSPSRMVPKRPANSTGIVSPASTSPPNKKMPISGVDILRLKPCAKCTLPVFFAERLNVGKHLYHRTCFRCARCNNQLTLANSYETETPNQYCCETCPDEEPSPSSPANAAAASVDKPSSTILSRSLSDEEKSAGLKTEQPSEEFKPRESSAGIARKSFLHMNMLTTMTSDVMPDLPRSARPSVLMLSDVRNSEHQSDITDVDVNSNTDSGRSQSAVDDSVHIISDVNNHSDMKVQSAEDSLSVKARRRIFEMKFDPQPFTTKATEIDLSKVTEPKVPIAEEHVDEKTSNLDDASLDVADQSDSISLVDKESAENVQADSTYESIITVSDDTDNRLSKTEYKTTCEDSIISISDQSHISKESNQFELDSSSIDTQFISAQYTGTIDESVISITDESSISQEPDQSLSETNLLLEKLPETLYKTAYETPVSDTETSDDVDKKRNSLELKTEDPDHFINNLSDVSQDELSSSTEIKSHMYSESPESIEPLQVKDISDNVNDLDSGLQSMQPSILEESKPDNNDHVLVSDEESVGNVEIDSGRHPSLTEDSSKLTLTRESYPGDLNPFGDDEDDDDDSGSNVSVKQSPYNPFDEDEDGCEEEPEPGTPTMVRRLIKLRDEDKMTFTPGRITISRTSEVFDREFKTPVPVTRKKLPAPKISLTPFWDRDNDDFDQSRVSSSIEQTPGQLQCRPRISDVSSSIVSPHGSSTTSLTSITTTSSAHSGTKKKAPAPPKPPSSSQDSEQYSLTSSPSTSVQHSPRSTARPRKSKKAPAPPPALASTPSVLNVPLSKMSISPIQFGNTKVAKDEVNRNRRSQTFDEPTSPISSHAPDKSMQGKWKRKKNIAPDKPVAIRRTIKALPMVEVKRELDIIEVQQQGLERQGVKLEHIIRMRCESVDSELNEDNIPIEVEDMILQLFEVVNEKNELCRRQAELMYLKKQHRLEEEHAEVEYQIRCFMLMSDQNKTDTDKSKEEELIKRLLEIVEKKNEIIECLDMDRVREHEEDNSFTSSMNNYANRRDAAPSTAMNDADSNTLSKKEKKKFRKKFKLKIGGSHQQVDADKDIDETEVNQVKEKKKKKFAIFR